MTRRPSAVAASLRSFAAALGLTATLSGVLAACGGDGGSALGKQACNSVEASIRAFRQSAHAVDPQQRAALVRTASDLLRKALPPASLAAEQSSDWQALEATLDEAQNGISEANLITALSAKCGRVAIGARCSAAATTRRAVSVRRLSC